MAQRARLQWNDGPLVTSSLYDHVALQRQFALESSEWPASLGDPFRLTDMAAAAERVVAAIVTGEKIAIIGDYDCDGTPAAAIIAETLMACGQVPMVVIPKREQGYGFSVEHAQKCHAAGVTLIITVDCGITSHDAVELSRKLGCDVVITDHHECPTNLPAAAAVVNPHRIDDGGDPLCGSGVALMLSYAIAGRLPPPFGRRFGDTHVAWQLDLAALATLGDAVPLVGPNRAIAKLGLKVLQRGRRIGLRYLMESCAIRPEEVTFDDCTFKLIPRLNAVGRRGAMDPVYRLLVTQDRAEAKAIVEECQTAYAQIRRMCDSAVNEAAGQIRRQADAPIHILVADSWLPGVTGLIASRLVEQTGKPTLVLAASKDGLLRGSGRGPDGFNLHETIAASRDLFQAFGGHKQAIGVSLNSSNLDLLRHRLASVDFTPEADVTTTEGTLAPEHATVEQIASLDRLTPWGVANPQPLWSLAKVEVERVTPLAGGEHVKCGVGQYRGLEVMVFRAKNFGPIQPGGRVRMCGTLGLNQFRGRVTPQFICHSFEEV